MNTITILFFAHLKELAGTNRLRLEVPSEFRILDLRQRLIELHPALRAILPSALASINQSFAFDDDTIPPEAEVAFFPPVSGGSGFPQILRITEDALNLDDLVAQVTLPTTGAVAVFAGLVRGQTSRGTAHETSWLEYEAYVPMAEKMMGQVAQEIRERWPVVEGIAIVQRIGRLAPGTPTVLIACSAAHRDTGVFEAAHYGIDRLKEIVPVWKKEIGPGGQAWVEGEFHPERGENDE
jgi:MoaE-MoaD fusion protein